MAPLRPQRSTLKSKSKNTKDINEAVGCPRGGTITSLVPFPFSASTPVCDLYLSEFLPVHSAPAGLDHCDRWYSVRPNKKRARVPRFTALVLIAIWYSSYYCWKSAQGGLRIWNFQLTYASLSISLPSTPKGAIGIQCTRNSAYKALRYDRNLALWFWESLLGEEAIVLRFISRHFNVYFRTQMFRFC